MQHSSTLSLGRTSVASGAVASCSPTALPHFAAQWINTTGPLRRPPTQTTMVHRSKSMVDKSRMKVCGLQKKCPSKHHRGFIVQSRIIHTVSVSIYFFLFSSFPTGTHLARHSKDLGPLVVNYCTCSARIKIRFGTVASNTQPVVRNDKM